MNLGFLAKHLNGELHGSPDFKITGVCDIFNLSAGKISFVLDTKYSSFSTCVTGYSVCYTQI